MPSILLRPYVTMSAPIFIRSQLSALKSGSAGSPTPNPNRSSLLTCSYMKSGQSSPSGGSFGTRSFAFTTLQLTWFESYSPSYALLKSLSPTAGPAKLYITTFGIETFCERSGKASTASAPPRLCPVM